MSSFSIGIAKVSLGGVDLGSCTSASVDMQVDTYPIHSAKVGQAYIVADHFAVKGISGSLSVSSEEVGSLRSLLDIMLDVLKGSTPVKQPFTCSFPLSGGSISGQVLMLPQFSASVNPEGWSSQPVEEQLLKLLLVEFLF